MVLQTIQIHKGDKETHDMIPHYHNKQTLMLLISRPFVFCLVLHPHASLCVLVGLLSNNASITFFVIVLSASCHVCFLMYCFENISPSVLSKRSASNSKRVKCDVYVVCPGSPLPLITSSNGFFFNRHTLLPYSSFNFDWHKSEDIIITVIAVREDIVVISFRWEILLFQGYDTTWR